MHERIKRKGACLLACMLWLLGMTALAEGAADIEVRLPPQAERERMIEACRRFFKAARGPSQTVTFEEALAVDRDMNPSLAPPDGAVRRTCNRYRWTTLAGAIERAYTAYTDLEGRVYRLTYEGPSLAAATPWPLGDEETTRTFVKDWLKEVGWQQAQIVEVATCPAQQMEGPMGWQGHEVLLWFPGGMEARVKVHTAAAEVRSVMWSEQAPSGQKTRVDEALWYEQQARAAVRRYLGEELPEAMNVSVDTGSQYVIEGYIPVWAWKIVELVPKDGSDWLYRVELNGDGIRRVQRAYTGAQMQGDIYSAQDAMLTAWDARWAQKEPQRVRALEGEISAYLDEQGITYEPWDGSYGVSGMMAYHGSVIAGKDTDYYLLYAYAKPGGSLYTANEYIQVGYSLYQNRIAYIDLCVDGNG